MDVCPKCHNTIVYGMNCCTGKRTLNMAPEPTSLSLQLLIEMSCKICGFAEGHDPWKHDVIERLDALEKEIAQLKGRKT